MWSIWAIPGRVPSLASKVRLRAGRNLAVPVATLEQKSWLVCSIAVRRYYNIHGLYNTQTRSG
jgi:hypothetical protein